MPSKPPRTARCSQSIYERWIVKNCEVFKVDLCGMNLQELRSLASFTIADHTEVSLHRVVNTIA